MHKRRGKAIQKFISFCLTAALAAGMLLGKAPLKVNAAESTVSSFTDLKNAIDSASGDLTLTVVADIGMTETIFVPEGSTVTLLSDGNHTMKRQAGFWDAMFEVSGTLKLGSADGMAGNGLTLDGGAVWTGTADAVLERGQTNSGLIAVDSLLEGNTGSSIYLYSGVTLQNNFCNSTGRGGAVTIQGSSLYLYGAVLCNHYSAENAGAVKAYAGSRLTMNAGEVYGNQAYRHGGAFQIWDLATEVICQISGGTIRNNLCNGVGGGIAVSDYSRLELSGNAVIRDNKTMDSQKRGGGIGFADSDTSLQISDNVVISGNMGSSGANNLFIGYKDNNKINVESLSANARIGITMSNSQGVFSNVLDKDYSAGFFSDNDSYTVVSQDGNVLALVKNDHVHSPGSEWKSDEAGHWHECACGNRTDEAAHTENNGTEIKAPTITEAGEKAFHCSVCGWLIRTEVIPATGSGENPGENTGGDSGNTDGGNGESTGGSTGGETNSGSTGQNPASGNTAKVRTEIEKGENAPETTISMSEKDLTNVVLTEEEKQQSENGLDIKILLTVTDAGNSVSEEEKKTAEGALGSYEMGQYLDISLFKVIGETHNRITETTGMIQITIAIPENLKSSDNAVHREYMIIRVHNGEPRILADKDNDADTITIETNCFSTYALAYKDSPAEQGNEKDKEPKTGDTEPIRLYATIAMIAGFAYLLLYFADHGHGMTEKQKKELVDRIIRWAHRGGRMRRVPAFAAILLLLVYYHGIGKKTAVKWQEI